MELKQYLALRKKLVTSVPLSTLKDEAASYIGKVFEVRGTVSGFISNGSEHCIVINSRSGESFTIATDRLPEENPGSDYACLVKIGQGSTYSLSDLSLVTFTYDVILRRYEASQIRPDPKPAPQKVRTMSKPVTSRGKAKSSTVTVSADQLIFVYKNAIKNFNSRLSDSQADTIARSILGFSQKYKVDPRLVCAVILAESHFRVNATSSAGARGLGQLMPSTAAGLGVNDAYDPVDNIYGSVRYIRGMLDRMTGNKEWNELTWNDLALALAAYNAGPGAVKKHGGVPPYRETQNYVRRVTNIYKQLCGVK